MEKGNVKAIREALESVRNWCLNRLVNSSHQVTVEGLLSVVNTALAKPPRNCDVGTADEQLYRHKKYCNLQPTCKKWLRDNSASRCISCFANW